MASDDPESLERWLSDVGVDVNGVRALVRWNSESPAEAGLPRHRRLPPDFAGRVDEVLDRAFGAALTAPFGPAVLCWYIRAVCENAWKDTYHFDRMWPTLRGAVRWWDAHRADIPDEGESASTQAVTLLLESLDWEIAVENEMLCANAHRLASAAGHAAACARDAIAATAWMREVFPTLGAPAAECARAAWICNGALVEAAQALIGLAERRDVGGFDRAVSALVEAERRLGDDADRRSTVRAYRRSLETLRRRADDEWVHVDNGAVVHVYPFAVRGIPPARVVEAVRAGAASWLVTCGVAGVRETLDLDDVWNGSDALGRRYEGAVVTLPEVIIADLDERPLGSLAAEIRFSVLGNHYLRLAAHLADATPFDVYAAMFRSAPEHGEVRVRCGTGHRVWPRLSAFAVDVIESIGECLAGQARVSVRPGMFHVLVTVLEASAASVLEASASHSQGPGDAMADTERLFSAVGGGVLVQPVPNIIGAPAEWVMYPPPDARVGLDLGGREDEVVARTCNTTLIAALGSPAYWIGCRQTVAEFVASLDGLFAGWFDELAIALTRAMTVSSGLDGLDDSDVETLTRQVGLVEREQRRLQAFSADTRFTLDLLRSPALVASPLVARELQALLDASDFERRAGELGRNLDVVLDERLGRRLEELVARRHEREARAARVRERRQRIRLDTMLAAIAAVGLSGIGQIVQAGFDVGELGTLWLICAIVVVVVLVGVIAWLSGDRSEPGDDQRGSDGE